jgi:hypothetical protein
MVSRAQGETRKMRVTPPLLLVLVLGACGKQSEVHQLQGVTYYFPRPHISGLVEPEESGSGQYYIRLIPPGGYYWLVYDPKSESRPNKQGRGVPTITHINDASVALKVTHKRDEIEIVRNEAGQVICKKIR